MGLKEEIDEKRATIHTDGYPMSIGELLNLYRDNELDIHPEFQRFFRWTQEQKSRFVESLLLGIPIPSIFVSQRQSGVWDVVDGLQRLSTVFQLTGILRDENGDLKAPLVLSGTKYLPALEGKHWGLDGLDGEPLDDEQKLIVKRTKLDIKIVLRESDEASKYELFQRINTGGSQLSDQELRNCILIMVSPEFYRWLAGLATDENFNTCIALSDRAKEEQYDVELAVRFLVFRQIAKSLRNIGDLGDFLTDEVMCFAKDPKFDKELEEEAFRFTFERFAKCFEENAFCRYVPQQDRFKGGFLISAYEVLAIGLGSNFETYRGGVPVPDLAEKAKLLWQREDFLAAIGSGVRASQRIPVTIPLGRELMKP